MGGLSTIWLARNLDPLYLISAFKCFFFQLKFLESSYNIFIMKYFCRVIGKIFKMIINFDYTVEIWITDLSGIQVINICPIVKWSVFQMVFWIKDKIVPYSDHGLNNDN